MDEYTKVFAMLAKGEKLAEKPKGVQSGTLNWLWAQYNKSAAWTQGLKPSTRRQRENIMKHVLKGGGTIPIQKIDRAIVIRGREGRSTTPSAANNYLATFKHLFAWAIDAEYMKKNPCDGVALVDRPDTYDYPAWTDEDEAKFIARWPLGAHQYLAYMVHACTGLRRGDAVRLGR